MKKNKSKKLLILAMSLLILVFFTGCAKSSEPNYKGDYDTSSPEKVDEYEDVENNASEEVDGGHGDTASPETPPSNLGPNNDYDKIIKTYELEMESKDFDGLVFYIENSINKNGGYIESSKIEGKSYDYSGLRNAYFVARIPKDNCSDFIYGVEGQANLTSKLEDSENVTLAYQDSTNRKKALEIQEERLLDMLKESGSLEEMLTLERRLSDVRYEINHYTSSLREYDDKISYSTVNIRVREVERIVEKSEDDSAWKKMSDGFKENFIKVKDGLVDFLVGIVAGLPFIIATVLGIGIILIITLIIIKIINGIARRHYRKKTENKKTKQEAKAKKDKMIDDKNVKEKEENINKE